MKFKPEKIRAKHVKRTVLLIVSLLLVDALLIAGYSLWKEEQIKPQLQSSRVVTQQANERIAAIEKKKKEPVFITLPGAQPFRAILEDYDQPSSLWAMANKQRSLPIDYRPEQIVIPDVPTRTDKTDEERSVRSDVAGPLKELFDAAAADGHSLMIGSAYRSATLQAAYFNSYVAASGLELANQYSARPGQSEHQLGLSVDISTLSRQCYLSECFTSTPDGIWLAENAYKFGFSLRYLKGKEAITGYNFEPWHYRYVGVELATALHESGLTLEEAWPLLIEARDTLKKNRAI